MQHLFLWFYIVTLLVTAASITSSVLMKVKIKESWYRYYFQILASCAGMMFSYTVFYFIFVYGYQVTPWLTRLHVLILYSIGTYLLYLVFLLGCHLVDPQLAVHYRKRLSYFFICLLIVQGVALFLFLNEAVFVFFLSLMLLLYLFFFAFILKHRKKVKIHAKNRILLLVFLLTLCLLPLDWGEYYWRKKIAWYVTDTYIPMGIITFTVYCLAINCINLIFNVRLIYHSSFSINQHYPDDIPQTFLTKFAITSREREVIEYLLKGYQHKDISCYLHISRRTVDRHVYNVYRKCAINTKVDLINLVRDYH